MAIKQTVVFTNSAASFTSIDQALASMNAALVDVAQKEELDTRNVAGEFTADVWFDFIMPENGNVLFDGIVNWNNFQLFDVCNSTQISCGSETLLAENLVEGNHYKLRVFRQEANASTASFQSFTAMFQETLSINDNEENDIHIYPNPTTEWLFISSTSSIKNIELYDILGKKVLNVANNHQIDLSSLYSGVYFIKITSDKGEITKKIIKK